jgi:hypothetical protein
MKEVKMHYVLVGFSENLGCRVFRYEGVADKVRLDFTVSADLTLARKHGIRLQELPLLCQAALEKLDGAPIARALTFSEADMAEYACQVRERQAVASKRHRKFGARASSDVALPAPHPRI